MPPRPRFPRPALALALALAAGCGDESKPKTKAAPATAPPADNFIVGKTTQDVRKVEPELQKGAKVASTQITAKDPITLQGNAYVTVIGKTSILNIQHAIDLYQAEHGSYPKTYDEFMAEIIKANNIALPRLPHYQKYGYDEKEHKLVVLEYPELKAQPAPQ